VSVDTVQRFAAGKGDDRWAIGGQAGVGMARRTPVHYEQITCEQCGPVARSCHDRPAQGDSQSGKLPQELDQAMVRALAMAHQSAATKRLNATLDPKDVVQVAKEKQR